MSVWRSSCEREAMGSRWEWNWGTTVSWMLS